MKSRSIVSFIITPIILLALFSCGGGGGGGEEGTPNPGTAIPGSPEIKGIANGSFNVDQTFTLTGLNGALIEYSLDGGNSWVEYSELVGLSDEDSYIICARQSLNGKTSPRTDFIRVIIDKTLPDSPLVSGVMSGYYNYDQSFTVEGEEDAQIYYTIDGGTTWSSYPGEISLSKEDDFTIMTKQTDLAGNASSNSTPIWVVIDKTPPAEVTSADASELNQKVILCWSEPESDQSFSKVHITFTPTEPGVNQPIEVNSGTTDAAIKILQNGTPYQFSIKAVDKAGNESNSVTYVATPVDDTTPPAPGNGGTISVTYVQNRSFWINWDEANDVIAPQRQLKYKIVISTEDNISAINEAEQSSNGRKVVKDWTSDMFWSVGKTSYEIVGLVPNTQYYYTVLVKDNADNKSIYTTGSITTVAGYGVPEANGIVRTMVLHGTTLYIGGSYTYLGGTRGGVLDSVTGKLVSSYTPPNIDGTVYVAVPDGKKGWYIGGSFGNVNRVIRNGVARISADGSLHAWKPVEIDVNARVESLLLRGKTLYLGGYFKSVGSQTRNYLAAVDITSGEVTPFNPNPNATVNNLALNGKTLYVGGSFTTIGGQTRNLIAALDADTGTIMPWNPNPDSGDISAIKVSGEKVYVSGMFGKIGGQSRNYIAAIDPVTGSATSWNPKANGSVRAIVTNGDTVYAGGSFTKIGGQSIKYLAAIDANDGTVTSWNPNPNGMVGTIAVSGNTVYAGGNFTKIGEQSKDYLASIDATTAVATSWDPVAASSVYNLALEGDSLFICRAKVCGARRNRLASVDISNGTVTSWNPGSNNTVHCLLVSNDTVYAGGEFTSVGVEARNRLAAIDAATGIPSSWDPDANNTVYALAISGTTLYTGGAFTNIKGETRNRLAAINTSMGNPLSYNPDVNDTVLTLAVSGNNLYLGGDFAYIGGILRRRLASIDVSTNQLTTWDPSADGTIKALLVHNGTLYVGGNFTEIAGNGMLWYVAAFNISDHSLTDWEPVPDKWVGSISVSDNIVYLGGAFTVCGGKFRNNFAAIDAVSGEATSWNPDVNNSILTSLAYNNVLYVGGDFYELENSFNDYFGAIDENTKVLLR